jgi:transposase
VAYSPPPDEGPAAGAPVATQAPGLLRAADTAALPKVGHHKLHQLKQFRSPRGANQHASIEARSQNEAAVSRSIDPRSVCEDRSPRHAQHVGGFRLTNCRNFGSSG